MPAAMRMRAFAILWVCVAGGSGFLPIVGPVSDMSSEFHFNLTSDDLASGTSHWEVIPIPGPSALAILILGVAGLGRKRRGS